jgi:hypothetical protein
MRVSSTNFNQWMPKHKQNSKKIHTYKDGTIRNSQGCTHGSSYSTCQRSTMFWVQTQLPFKKKEVATLNNLMLK